MASSTSLGLPSMEVNNIDCSLSGMALKIGATSCIVSTLSVPERLRRRLLETIENKQKTHSSLEEIETKLKEADIRRHQFHEWLANKARPKPKSLRRAAYPKELAQRLEAKLCAAKHKRLGCLHYVLGV
eukprot:Gb_16959 [translate_table: standard]